MLKILRDSRLQYVDRLSTSSGISLLFTHSPDNSLSGAWLQVRVYALFVRCLWTSTSTALGGNLTSLNNYLYPLSTVPIMITTNFNKLIIIKERA